MVKKLTVIAATSAFLLVSCSNKKSSVPEPAKPGAPVETASPNASYRPAFEGQTRIGGVKTATAYSTKILTSSLESPWGIQSLPNGKFLVTEKAGRMRIVTADGNISNPITGVPPVSSAGQGGLLGLCLDPDFATNRMVYWSFSESGNLTAIAKGRLSEDERALESVTVIYRATPAYSGALHYGGRVVFDRAGNLLISTGERSDLVTRPQAQDPNSSLGKIIRITTSGQPATGN
ncbi:MAG: PQQ-dependent sugar dehydrogenase, partial [Chitinophagaceae bacterium]